MNKHLAPPNARIWAQKISKQRIASAGRMLAPLLIALALSTAAHAQGTMSFSGAQTLMGTFQTFALYAGAVTRVHPELINTRFAYVSVSRASHEAQIDTNDAAALGERLSHDASKTSAIDLNPPLLDSVDATIHEQLHSSYKAEIVRGEENSCFANVTAFPNATTRHHVGHIFADLLDDAQR